jgi:hypothetical protein
MTKGKIAGGALAAVLVVLALVVGRLALQGNADLPPVPPSMADAEVQPPHGGLLYGRVTTDDGTVYEGRLRWGGDQEALWGHPFNGYKEENPWAARVPRDERPRERMTVRVFGREIHGPEREMDLGRPFMARFGDIARIERRGGDIEVTLKSGTVVVLDRMASDDLGDGLRVWDGTHGVVDLGERQIRAVELLSAPPDTAASEAEAGPNPLYGTVHTAQGNFTGMVQWNRAQCLGSDEIIGQAADDRVLHLPFDAIRSIARRSPNGSRVTLRDDSEVVLTGTPDVGRGNRGLYVDDPRYGRVLVSWDAFESVDFSAGARGPTYGDFPPGHPLAGTVVTRSGRRLAGRLIFDLDESETTETLDAPSEGVNYMIPFGLVQTIVPVGPMGAGAQRVRVTLRTGEELRLEPDGDLGEGNGGMLVFTGGSEQAEYVPWTDVGRIDLDGPPEG